MQVVTDIRSINVWPISHYYQPKRKGSFFAKRNQRSLAQTRKWRSAIVRTRKTAFDGSHEKSKFGKEVIHNLIGTIESQGITISGCSV